MTGVQTCALPICQDEVFDIPEDFDPCCSKFQLDSEEEEGEAILSGDDDSSISASDDSDEEGFDDIFE